MDACAAWCACASLHASSMGRVRRAWMAYVVVLCTSPSITTGCLRHAPTDSTWAATPGTLVGSGDPTAIPSAEEPIWREEPQQQPAGGSRGGPACEDDSKPIEACGWHRLLQHGTFINSQSMSWNAFVYHRQHPRRLTLMCSPGGGGRVPSGAQAPHLRPWLFSGRCTHLEPAGQPGQGLNRRQQSQGHPWSAPAALLASSQRGM